ncbi:MAG: hypothetical protein CME70_03185 [Halobacteriovorax sp.]|nr:hypothetical protein [Halobacteriovorax sp.]MBK22987.1 hypothetical protein [Halobacteriovorax sp.]
MFCFGKKPYSQSEVPVLDSIAIPTRPAYQRLKPTKLTSDLGEMAGPTFNGHLSLIMLGLFLLLPSLLISKASNGQDHIQTNKEYIH